MEDARPLPMTLTLDGEPITSATTIRWSGASVLTFTTAITHHADLALTLTSVYVGSEFARTHVTYLQQGPTGQRPTIEAVAFHDAEEPEHSKVAYRPNECADDHAQRLLAWLKQLGHRPRIQLTDDTTAALQAN
jgi:hypothetical protein